MKEGMHDCQKFREDWLARPSEDSGDCADCRRFCEESAALLQTIDAASPPPAEFSDDYWDAFQGRMRESLAQATPSRSPSPSQWVTLVAAASLVLAVTSIGIRLTRALEENVRDANAPTQMEFADDHIKGLDPQVVDFLRQSELDLRSFTKIEPTYVYAEEIEDARARANRQLEKLIPLKAATADFPPVRIALDEYESVLRETRNLETFEDVADIQRRIERNGLIANFKAYQPRVVFVGGR